MKAFNDSVLLKKLWYGQEAGVLVSQNQVLILSQHTQGFILAGCSPFRTIVELRYSWAMSLRGHGFFFFFLWCTRVETLDSCVLVESSYWATLIGSRFYEIGFYIAQASL